MVARVANQTAMPAIATPMSHVPDVWTMRRHSGGRGAIVAELIGAALAGATLAGSSRTNSATAMSAMRCRRSFARHRRSSVRIAAGTSAGSAAQSGSPRSTAASVSLTSSPSKRTIAGEHLVQHTAKRPHVTPLVRRPSLRLLRRHVRRRAENHAGVGHLRRRRDRRRGRDVSRAGRGVRVRELREAEVEHFHHAVRRDLDVRGLQVAMDDPLLVGGFEGLADLTRTFTASPCETTSRGFST